MKPFFLLIIAFALTEARASDPHYKRLFEDGKLDVTVALGFEQVKPETTNPVLKNIAKFFLGAFRDDFYTRNDVDSIDRALLNCLTCGLKPVSSSKGYRNYKGGFEFEGKKIETRVTLLFSENGVEVSGLKKLFIESLRKADVIIYLGHSRNGGGIPDFAAPTVDTGKVFYDDPVTGWNGFNKGYFSRTKYQIMVLNACKTKKYFLGPFRKGVWEKKPEDIAYIVTNENTYFDDYAPTTAALIGALVDQLPKEDLMLQIESAAGTYRDSHMLDMKSVPLFTSDGLFDNSRAGAKPPKRVEPREPLRDFPF